MPGEVFKLSKFFRSKKVLDVALSTGPPVTNNYRDSPKDYEMISLKFTREPFT